MKCTTVFKDFSTFSILHMGPNKPTLVQAHPDDVDASLPAVSLGGLAKTSNERSREAPCKSVRSGEVGETLSREGCCGATFICLYSLRA